MGINEVVLVGRIVNDLALRTTPRGTDVLNICVAVDRKKTGDDRNSDFIDCTAWDNAARFVHQYFEKGSPIAIVGELRTEIKENKGGNKVKYYSVKVNEVSFAGHKKDAGFGNDADMKQVFASDEMFGELPY